MYKLSNGSTNVRGLVYNGNKTSKMKQQVRNTNMASSMYQMT